MSPLERPRDVEGFPAFLLRRGRPLFRVHARGLGPWWFNSSGEGRFDLPPPRGTCYLAEDPLGAFVEVFRDTRGIARTQLEIRALATVRPREQARLADVTVARARRFGITLEIGTTEDYALTQEWARTLAAAGFAGIRYRLRHDPAGSLLGIALFGDAGERAWPYEDRDISEDVVAAARRRFGIVVLPATLA